MSAEPLDIYETIRGRQRSENTANSGIPFSEAAPQYTTGKYFFARSACMAGKIAYDIQRAHSCIPL
jgi:hypothetical protein